MCSFFFWHAFLCWGQRFAVIPVKSCRGVSRAWRPSDPWSHAQELFFSLASAWWAKYRDYTHPNKLFFAEPSTGYRLQLWKSTNKSKLETAACHLLECLITWILGNRNWMSHYKFYWWCQSCYSFSCAANKLYFILSYIAWAREGASIDQRSPTSSSS